MLIIFFLFKIKSTKIAVNIDANYDYMYKITLISFQNIKFINIIKIKIVD